MDQNDAEYEKMVEEAAKASGISVEEAREELDGLRRYVRDKTIDIPDIHLNEPHRPYKRDKRKNTPEFNKRAKDRRAKAKHDAKGRKTSRKKK